MENVFLFPFLPMRKKISRLIIVVLLGIIIGFFYLNKNRIYAAMDRYKLIPIPEHFTELYFNTYPTFSEPVVAGQKVDFSFTVHNLEGAEIVYPYDIFFQTTDGEQIILQTNSITLTNGETKTIAESYTFKYRPKPGGIVIIKLLNLNQEIRFLLSVTN